MKKTVFLLFLFCVLIESISAQEGGVTLDGEPKISPDFIVLIDGKLPRMVFVEVSWENVTERQTLTYVISYSKTIFLYPSFLDTLSILDSLPGATDLHIEITFEEPLGYLKDKKHVYSSDLELMIFRRIGLITITNFNKKKNIYYVHYITAGSIKMSPRWKKEYGNKRKFEKRVLEGVYPFTYVKTEGVKGEAGKPYPIY